MPNRSRGVFLFVALWVGCAPSTLPPRGESVLRVGIPSEPQTWNQLLVSERTTYAIADQLHDPLVRVNPETQEVEPALAESWQFDPDGRRLVFRLRPGLRFSDGTAASANDVAFTFRALYDPKVASPLAETARIDGKDFEVEVVDPSTVAFTLPRRTASVERVFDAIPVLPAHRLEMSLERGTLAADSGVGAPVSQVVGLGPFRLLEHRAGERVVLERNPHYWRRDEGGEPLPRLDRLVFDIAPDPSTRLLRFRSGATDLLEHLTPDMFDSLERRGSDEIDLVDLGPGLLTERLWFNLSSRAAIEEQKKRWFAEPRFRRAISAAIDRAGLARVVFSGRATPASGSVSAANRWWKDPSLAEIRHDPHAARALLADAGYRWSDEGRLQDPERRPVSFTILTNSETSHRASVGAFLQEDLAQIGIEARTAVVQGASLLGRVTGTLDYEAGLLGLSQTDPDPTAEMAMWLSRAPLHLWNPRQDRPATSWEARIDELMEQQAGELDPGKRRELYFEVQRILSEWRPVIDLVVPHALIASWSRVRNLRPTPLAHVLWNSEEIAVSAEARPDADAVTAVTERIENRD